MKKFLVSLLCLAFFFTAGFCLVGCGKATPKIEFMVDDVVYDTVETNGNETITLPDDPSKVGYTFDGWFLDKDVWQQTFTSNLVENFNLNKNLKIYAKFQIISYNIDYHLDKYQYTENPATYTVEDSIQLSDATTENGYVFTGWYTDSQLEHPLTSIPKGSLGNIDLYAKFELAFTASNDQITGLTDFGKTLSSIVIPKYMNDISITSIKENAFKDCTGLTSITIPNSITVIEDFAFFGCTGLISITIPNSVTSIGTGAISYCTGLTSISIPDSITSIGILAFGCSGLTSISIPDSVTSIGDRAFYSCKGLTSITIPNSVTTIGDRAFCECTELKDIYFTGSESEWNSIYIVCSENYACFGNATIHFNRTKN